MSSQQPHSLLSNEIPYKLRWFWIAVDVTGYIGVTVSEARFQGSQRVHQLTAAPSGRKMACEAEPNVVALDIF
ncbi:uncharacterized protein C21orf62 isoform X9 [Anopheles sinensis]|uniref:Uncharacterized protein C21orf62 isoform X9 n=1 Tax=Anopheles sinensis TaxID=74873 RepID=A0A084WF18_ANOSI|nr:uncharacterized protein C21orf62 isoform X9 [Anopheles sinensis]